MYIKLEKMIGFLDSFHKYFMRITEPPHDKTNKMACAPSKDSDRPGHPPSLITVFAVHMKKSFGPKLEIECTAKTDQTGQMTDLSLCWTHMPFCWFCHEATQFSFTF